MPSIAERELQKINQLIREMRREAPQLSPALRQIERDATAAFKGSAEAAQNLESNIQSLINAFSNIGNLGNQVQDRLAGKAGQLESAYRSLNTELAKTSRNLESQRVGASAGGSSGAEDQISYISTFGRSSPSARGIVGGLATPDKIVRAQQQALSEIDRVYGRLGAKVQDYQTQIDAATGRITVHAQAVKKLDDQTTQSFRLTATADPFTGQATTFTPQQQAFIDQTGGLERARAALDSYGLGLRNVVAVHKDLTSDVTKFAVVGPRGYEQGQITVDKFGNAILQTSRNAQTLVQNIQRNITKVIEWGVATGVVFGILNQLGQSAREMEEIEEVLADITIATGAGAEELQMYYDAALDVAKATGTDVVEALEAHQFALRATAGEANQMEVSQQLLADAMTLARLSGMEQTESLDTLVGALRQTGQELDQGSQLLDKWVRVSKNAGVSVEDMAQSFAITAAASENVGVGIDELNGLVAVLAENTTLSATEVGNALRTMMSNITAPEAIKQLQQFGIAVQDVDGNMRDWLEITEDIVSQMESGLLTEDQVNRLANALGGGSRRGPQIIALWQNYSRAQQLAAESSRANGDAADAMQVKVDTLNDALVNLNNAFNELAQTLGFDGGFLELMTSGVELLTDFVGAIDSLANTLDDSSSAIVASLGVLYGINRIGGGGGFGNLPGIRNIGIGGGGESIVSDPRTGYPTFRSTAPNRLGQFSGQQFGPGLESGIQGVIGPGLAVAMGEVLGDALRNELSGETAGRAGAAIAGAFVGNMILPGFGGLIGSVMADALVAGVQNRKDDFRFLGEELGTATSEQISTRLESRLEPIVNMANRTRGAGFLGIEALSLGDEVNAEDIQRVLLQASQRGLLQNLPTTGRGTSVGIQQLSGVFQERGLTASDAALLAQIAGEFSEEELQTLADAVETYEERKREEADAIRQAGGGFDPSAFDVRAAQLGRQFSDDFSRTFNQLSDEAFRNAILSGESKTFQEFQGGVGFARSFTPRLAVARGGAGDLTAREYTEQARLVSGFSDEERARAAELVTQIADIQDQLENQRDRAGGGPDILGISNLESDLAAARGELEQFLQIAERGQQLEAARESLISPTFLEDISGVQLDQLVEAAREAQAVWLDELDIGEELADQLFDPILVKTADGFEQIEGLSKEFFNQVKEGADEMSSDLETKFSFKDLRDQLTAAQFPGLQQRAEFYEQFLQQQFGPAGYDEESQNIGLLLEGNQTRQLNTTMTALTLALEELTEVEKRQLEGFWNLPAGMTAFVPITSLFYQNQAPELTQGQTVPQVPQDTTTTQPQAVDVNVNVQNNNTIELDGRVVANQVTETQSRRYQQYNRAHRGTGTYVV